MAEKVYCGLETSCVSDLPQFLDQSFETKFDFVAAPLMHPRFRRDAAGVSDKREGPATRSDMVLDSRSWTTCVVGKLSPWIDLDSDVQAIRDSSEQAFKQEVAWASHLSVPAILCPPPSLRCFNYARCINQTVQASSFQQVWVRVPLLSVGAVVDDPSNVGDEEEDERADADPWVAWNRMRALCEYNIAMFAALELTADLPSETILDRWLGEPVKAVLLPTHIFLTNAKGYPTLSKPHQRFIEKLMTHKVQFLITGRAGHSKGYLPYIQYLEHISAKRGADTQQDLFEGPYMDYLQAPLQPLMDNLESQTYETFEKDPVKYREYEGAVAAALADTPEDKTTVLMVVGAGRGPLVRASLRASVTANRTLRVYAVEKNPNAVITLRNMKIAERWDNVTIVASDMRKWTAAEKADILVSELLGSFGDNELSPECLDGAQAFLKPDGISIPSSYTSFVAPVSSSKLWNEVKSQPEETPLKHFETPYVVRMHNHWQMTESKPVFTFDHPNWAETIDNRRFMSVTFTAPEAASIHGFGGYFSSHLYGSHYISIDPTTFSEGMFSWFPLFFPLRTPIEVTAGQTIEAHFWRCVSSTKVWYEWCVTQPTASPIHNPNGRSYWIGL